MKTYLSFTVLNSRPDKDDQSFWTFWLSFGEGFWLDDYKTANSITGKVYGSAAVCRAAENLNPGQYLLIEHCTV
jgi:hypothetical protein